MTALTLGSFVTSDRTVTGGAGDVAVGADDIMVLIQRAADAAGAVPEAIVMTGEAVGLRHQSGVAGGAIYILVDADLVMVLINR